jgi:hypothetical protein
VRTILELLILRALLRCLLVGEVLSPGKLDLCLGKIHTHSPPIERRRRLEFGHHLFQNFMLRVDAIAGREK